jgi:outer membrane protein assembly factor BamB
MIIKVILLLLLSSCSNKYLGTIEEDYYPTKKIVYLEKNQIEKSSANINFLNSNRFEKFNIFQNSKLNLNVNKFNKIKKLFKNNSISNFVNFEGSILYISKNLTLNSYTNDKLIEKSQIPKQFINKNDQSFKIVYNKEQLFTISNFGLIFKIDKDWSFNFLSNLDKKIDFISSVSDKLLFIDLNGELITFDSSNNSFSSFDTIDINFGFKNKIYDRNTYADITLVNINTSTPAIIDNNEFQFLFIHTLDNINILSSIGDINELVNTPILSENGLIFVDASGKIINFEISADEILWEVNLNEIIVDFIQYSNSLILVTKNNLYILESKTGKLLTKSMHSLNDPSHISLVNSSLLLLGDSNLVLFDLSSSDPKIFKSIKFKNNNINDVGYSNGNYYLKNEDAVYTLSE